jgi:hypothetical protein
MAARLKRLRNATYFVLGVVGIGVNVCWAAGAHPVDRADDAFVSRVQSADIGFTSREGAIRRGHMVCASFAAGEDADAVAHDILSHSHLSTHQASELVAASVASYCQQYSASLTDQP